MRKFLHFLRTLAILFGLVIVLAQLLALGMWMEQARVPRYISLAVVLGLMVLAGAGAFTWLRYER